MAAQDAFLMILAWCLVFSSLLLSSTAASHSCSGVCVADEMDTNVHSDKNDDPRGPGTIRMAQRLKQLWEQRDPRFDHAIKSKQRVAYYEEAVKNQAGKTPSNKILQAGWRLGQELLNAGQTERAIETLDELADMVDEANLPLDDKRWALLMELRGISYLRLGEQQNCILRHSPDSCLIPIQGDGIHTIREPSAEAVKLFAKLLVRDPNNLSVLWLVNVAYMTLGRWPDDVPSAWLVHPDVFSSGYPLPRFRDVAGTAKVDIQGLCGGVVTEDMDGDGLLDVMVSDWSLEKQLRYLHNDGNGTFSDRTLAAGLEGLTGGLNMIHGDYDNDGFVDVFVLRGAWKGKHGHDVNSLLRNLGNGRFEDVTEAAGLGKSLYPTQTGSFVDYDRDGYLDLFIGNEGTPSDPVPCELYHNNGDGTFTNVAAEVGLDIVAFVKGATWGDYDNDGYPDLFLSRLYEPNLLLRNTDSGARFVDVSVASGIAGPLFTFPCWWWDYDNDGWQDLMVLPFPEYGSRHGLQSVAGHYRGLHLLYSYNATFSERLRPHLYRNMGDGTFEEVGVRVGLDVPMLAMGANFGDIDNDGWLDMYVGTGAPYLGTLTPNAMFRNQDGHCFQDVTTAGGFGHLQKGHGIAVADLDGDGDLDVYAVMGGAFEGDVFQNAMFLNPANNATHTGPNRWLDMVLQGTYSSRSAIGARIAVTVEYSDEKKPKGAAQRVIHRTVGTGGSFGSSSLRAHVGLGPATRIVSVEIHWPSPVKTATHTLTQVPLDSSIRILEGYGTSRWFKEERSVVDPPFDKPESSPECHHHHH